MFSTRVMTTQLPSIGIAAARRRSVWRTCCQQQDELGRRPSERRSLRGIAPADALLKSLGDIVQQSGVERATTSVVMGEDPSLKKWRELDNKLNEYPCNRVFTAIGGGGDSFVNAMVEAVETVLGSVHEENVAQRPSSGGRWVSVSITGCVTSSDQVVAVYDNMKRDERLRYLI